MANFQVANFTFGKNIKEDERQRLATAVQADTARRGQDIQAAQADANREENARQFDARMAQQQAAQDEGTRQFDERMGADSERLAENARQFDETQAIKKREYADRRGDIERANSWDDALKRQQMEKEDLEYQSRSRELERILSIRQKEDEERAHQREMMESAYGNAIIATELGGGFLTQRQVADFNERNGTNYNYVGKIDPTTGKPFSDGKIHFLEYALDDNGKLAIDQKSGRPMLNLDNPISSEFYGRTMDGYFGRYKDRLSSGGMSEERMQLERDRLSQRQQEEQGRNARAGSKNSLASARLAASVAKNMGDIKRGLRLDDEQAASFQNSLTKILSDAFAPTDEGAADDGKDKATVKSGDNWGYETAGQEPPNGQYKVEKDGISYHWGKSKGGKWGYFPDK